MAKDSVLTFFGELDRLLAQKPFRRFILFLADGRRYEIDGRTTLTVYATFAHVVSMSGIVYFPLNQISGFEVPEPLAGDADDASEESSR